MPRDINNRRRNNDCKIARWETIRQVVSYTSFGSQLRMELRIAIERPVFENGDKGFHRLNATIRVGSYFVRLATRAIIDLMDALEHNREKILAATEEIKELNEKHEAEQREEKRARRQRRANPTAEPIDYELLNDTELRKRHGLHFGPRKRKRHHNV